MMVKGRRQVLGWAARSGAALAGAALVAGGSGGVARAQAGQHLEGSWMFAAISAGGQAGPPRFLVTFTRDGLVIRTAPLQQAAPPALGVARMFISTTHGEWMRTGDREFAVTVVGFAFDETGNFLATQRIRATIRLDETLNTFTALSNVQFVTSDGSVIDGGTVPVQGTRIRVEPLGP